MDDDLRGLNVSKWLRRTWRSTGFYNTHGAQAIDLGAMAFPNLKGPGFKCPKHHWNQGIKSVQIYHSETVEEFYLPSSLLWSNA